MPGQQTSVKQSVVELRQYTLHPGQRDTLIELFDREFVETQEASGMRVVGQFYDLDDPDRFVWIRSFRDMPSRSRALTRFYVEGESWRTHGPTAKATMIDSANVMLLRPLSSDTVFPPPGTTRPPLGSQDLPDSRFLATIYYRDEPVDAEFVDFFEYEVAPTMLDTGAVVSACFETEPAENTFPRLPVREGENAFVWFSRFDSARAYADHLDKLTISKTWNQQVRPRLASLLVSAPEHLLLAPTSRSQLR